jgi:uncharacterized protein (TIGR02271 family)
MHGEERGIREGMEVYSSDGEKLGKVRALDADGFIIEKGFFFPKEYFVRYAHAASVTGDEIRLALHKDELGSAGEADRSYRSDAAERDRTIGSAPAGQMLADEPRSGAWDRSGGLRGQAADDVRMTRAEEELDVVKREREAGEVRLRKEIVTETKHVEVPVTREEVRVERVPIDAPRAATGDEARFREETVAMPLKEEEVEIRKRPVVKEEVRLRRDRVQHEQRADAEVRREEIRVDDEGADDGRTLTREERNEDVAPALGAPPRDDDLLR